MPPTPLTTYILLALAVGEMTAAEISTQIVRDSGGVLIVKVSSFYKALHRLSDDGCIERVLGRRYRLTNKGRRLLRWERARLLPVALLLRTRVD